MGEIVNLRQARKRKQREASASEAQANRLKFGRSLAEKKRQTAQTEKQIRQLDGHLRQPAKNPGDTEEG